MGHGYSQFTAALNKVNDENQVQLVPKKAKNELVVERTQKTSYGIVYGPEAISNTHYKRFYLPASLKAASCEIVGKKYDFFYRDGLQDLRVRIVKK